MKKRRRSPDDAGSQYDVQDLASAAEQTGLIPAAPADDAESEAYEEMWPLVAQRPVDRK